MEVHRKNVVEDIRRSNLSPSKNFISFARDSELNSNGSLIMLKVDGGEFIFSCGFSVFFSI